MNKEQFTSLSLDTSDRHFNYTLPYEDVTYDNMMEMFKLVAIAMSFSEDQFLDMCVNYIEQNGTDKYEVCLIDYNYNETPILEKEYEKDDV